ncbi:MAG: hypothetical protein IPP61_00600 [Cytophagaceae bacterium]|nr:hypothetical protein [Cytophagaceae bacterium]
MNGKYLSVNGFGLVSLRRKRRICFTLQPIGRTGALKSIIKGGGFTDYSKMAFIK